MFLAYTNIVLSTGATIIHFMNAGHGEMFYNIWVFLE